MVRTDQLAIPIVLFGPSRTGPQGMTGDDLEAGWQQRATGAEVEEARAHDSSATTIPAVLYQRMVRIVSYLFIAAVAAVNLVSSPSQVAVYVLLVAGIVLLVLFQDVLPARVLARWRVALEAAATIVFLTLLVMLTGGDRSPFFFGYILLLGAGSLWATSVGTLVLLTVTAVAYLLAVFVASGPGLYTLDGLARVAFNVVAMGLVTYVAWLIGREQRRAREEALRLSRFDSLTGLYSRSFFLSTVDREIPRASRTGRPFALLMFDLDGLKAANDRFGHESGDRLLQAVADVLRGDIRVTDVAARFGGDEFVLLLPETDMAGALRVAEKVRIDIARLALPNAGALIRTSASIGLVTYPTDGRTWPELMRRADLAMYEAKRRGRDQIVHYARGQQAAPAPEAASPLQESTGPPDRNSLVPVSMSPGSTQQFQTAQLPAPSTNGPPVVSSSPPQVIPQSRASPPAAPPAAPVGPTTTGKPFDIPPETPRPAPWERRGA